MRDVPPTTEHLVAANEVIPKRRLTAIDLFSGCGGLSLGLKQAHFDVLGAVEIDPLAVETYRTNHPDVRKVWSTDIRSLPPRHVMRRLRLKAGQLDLLAGCPPCQGFSSMRTLHRSEEADDPRNDLVLDFLRFIVVLRPKAIMMENVPGLEKNWRMAKFLLVLTHLGYFVDAGSVGICNVADHGVPQRRRRLLLMVGRMGSIPFAPADPQRRKVEDFLLDLPPHGHSGDRLHDLPEKRSDRVMKLIQQVPKDGGSRLALGEEYQLDCHKKCDGFKDVYGRMSWNKVAPTITGGCANPSKGRFLHPEQDRNITLREAALLQSFPSTYHFSLRRGKFAAAGLIGNALPPEFARRHAQRIAAYLTQSGE